MSRILVGQSILEETRIKNDKFSDKTLLITSRTGSFGHAVLSRFINDFKEKRIFSWGENMRDDMREALKSFSRVAV